MSNESKKKRIGEYLSGKVLSDRSFVRRLPLVAYFGFLIVLYMTNNFRLQAKYEYVEDLKMELDLVRTISVTVAEERVKRSSEKEIQRLLEEFHIELIDFEEQPFIIK